MKKLLGKTKTFKPILPDKVREKASLVGEIEKIVGTISELNFG
jgi:uncharacterized protein YktA (UPF0223 family)